MIGRWPSAPWSQLRTNLLVKSQSFGPLVNTPGSHLKLYLQILPEQEQKIQEFRSVAKQEFLKAIEGYGFVMTRDFR